MHNNKIQYKQQLLMDMNNPHRLSGNEQEHNHAVHTQKCNLQSEEGLSQIAKIRSQRNKLLAAAILILITNVAQILIEVNKDTAVSPSCDIQSITLCQTLTQNGLASYEEILQDQAKSSIAQDNFIRNSKNAEGSKEAFDSLSSEESSNREFMIENAFSSDSLVVAVWTWSAAYHYFFNAIQILLSLAIIWAFQKGNGQFIDLETILKQIEFGLKKEVETVQATVQHEKPSLKSVENSNIIQNKINGHSTNDLKIPTQIMSFDNSPPIIEQPKVISSSFTRSGISFPGIQIQCLEDQSPRRTQQNHQQPNFVQDGFPSQNEVELKVQDNSLKHGQQSQLSEAANIFGTQESLPQIFKKKQRVQFSRQNSEIIPQQDIPFLNVAPSQTLSGMFHEQGGSFSKFRRITTAGSPKLSHKTNNKVTRRNILLQVPVALVSSADSNLLKSHCGTRGAGLSQKSLLDTLAIALHNKIVENKAHKPNQRIIRPSLASHHRLDENFESFIKEVPLIERFNQKSNTLSAQNLPQIEQEDSNFTSQNNHEIIKDINNSIMNQDELENNLGEKRERNQPGSKSSSSKLTIFTPRIGDVKSAAQTTYEKEEKDEMSRLLLPLKTLPDQPYKNLHSGTTPQWSQNSKFCKTISRSKYPIIPKKQSMPPCTGLHSFYKNQLSQNRDLHAICTKKIKKLEKQLNNTKIFLNMVIHDMRNPTNSIEFALKEVIRMLKFDGQKDNNNPMIDFNKSPPELHRQLPNMIQRRIGGRNPLNLVFGTTQEFHHPVINSLGSNTGQDLITPTNRLAIQSVQYIQQDFKDHKLISPQKNSLNSSILLNHSSSDSINSSVAEPIKLESEVYNNNEQKSSQVKLPLIIEEAKVEDTNPHDEEEKIPQPLLSYQDYQNESNLRQNLLAQSGGMNQCGSQQESNKRMSKYLQNNFSFQKPLPLDGSKLNKRAQSSFQEDSKHMLKLKKPSSESPTSNILKKENELAQKSMQCNIDKPDEDSFREGFPSEEISSEGISMPDTFVKPNQPPSTFGGSPLVGCHKIPKGFENKKESRQFIQLTDALRPDNPTPQSKELSFMLKNDDKYTMSECQNPQIGSLQCKHNSSMPLQASLTNKKKNTDLNKTLQHSGDDQFELQNCLKQAESIENLEDGQCAIEEEIVEQSSMMINYLRSGVRYEMISQKEKSQNDNQILNEQQKNHFCAVHQKQDEEKLPLNSEHYQLYQTKVVPIEIQELPDQRHHQDSSDQQQSNHNQINGELICSSQEQNQRVQSRRDSNHQEESKNHRDVSQSRVTANFTASREATMHSPYIQNIPQHAYLNIADVKRNSNQESKNSSVVNEGSDFNQNSFANYDSAQNNNNNNNTHNHENALSRASESHEKRFEISQQVNITHQRSVHSPQGMIQANRHLSSNQSNHPLALGGGGGGMHNIYSSIIGGGSSHQSRIGNLGTTVNMIQDLYNYGGQFLSQEEKRQCEQLLRNSLFSSTMLINLINDLLDLAKIENSQFNFNTTQFNLHNIIQKAIDTLEFSAQQKSIRVEYVFEEENAGYLMEISGDDNRYLQILLNFLSNALKFTNANGKIIIETRVIDTQDIQALPLNITNQNQLKTPPPPACNEVVTTENGKKDSHQKLEQQNSKGIKRKTRSLGRVPEVVKCEQQPKFEVSEQSSQKRPRVSVPNHGNYEEIKRRQSGNQEKYIKFEIRIKDSGVGISPENLCKLFMNFGKLEEHAEGNKRGTGLGLSICKSLIELMGGTVTVESEVGIGTTFIMSLQTKCKVATIIDTQAWLAKYNLDHQNNGFQPQLASFNNDPPFSNTMPLFFMQKQGLRKDSPHGSVNHIVETPNTRSNLAAQMMLRKIGNSPNNRTLMNNQTASPFHQLKNKNLQNFGSNFESYAQQQQQRLRERIQTPKAVSGLPYFPVTHGSSNSLFSNSFQRAVQNHKDSRMQKTGTSSEIQKQPTGRFISNHNIGSPTNNGNRGYKASKFKKNRVNQKQSSDQTNSNSAQAKEEKKESQPCPSFIEDDEESKKEGLESINKEEEKLAIEVISNKQEEEAKITLDLLNQGDFEFDNLNDFKQNYSRNANSHQVLPLQMQSYHEQLQYLDDNMNMTNVCDLDSLRFSALVANDDMFQLTIITTVLQNCGFEVVTAENGLVAVQHQQARCRENAGFGFDVVLLDLDMPIMNGFEACKRIKQGLVSDDLPALFRISSKPKLLKIQKDESQINEGANAASQEDSNPVNHPSMWESSNYRPFLIALSALITESVITKGKESGFDDFIETPITADKVREKILNKLEEDYILSHPYGNGLEGGEEAEYDNEVECDNQEIYVLDNLELQEEDIIGDQIDEEEQEIGSELQHYPQQRQQNNNVPIISVQDLNITDAEKT